MLSATLRACLPVSLPQHLQLEAVSADSQPPATGQSKEFSAHSPPHGPNLPSLPKYKCIMLNEDFVYILIFFIVLVVIFLLIKPPKRYSLLIIPVAL